MTATAVRMTLATVRELICTARRLASGRAPTDAALEIHERLAAVVLPADHVADQDRVVIQVEAGGAAAVQVGERQLGGELRHSCVPAPADALELIGDARVGE